MDRRQFLQAIAALPVAAFLRGNQDMRPGQGRRRKKEPKFFPPGIYLHAGFSDSPTLSTFPGNTLGATYPFIRGIIYEIFWPTLHPTKTGALVVSGIQTALAYCRAQGIKLILQVKTGGPTAAGIPKWIGGVAVTSSSVANPSVITATAHGYANGDTVVIAGHSGSTPSINNTRYTITYIDDNSFSIPVNVTVGGTGGTVGNRPTLTISTEINPWPWDKAIRRAWVADCQKLGAMFDDDETLIAIYVAGVQAQYPEMSFPDSTSWATDPDTGDSDVDAYSVALLIDNWNKAIDGMRRAFPRTNLIAMLDQHPNPSGAGTFDTAFWDGSVDVGVLAHINDDPGLHLSFLVGTVNCGNKPAAVVAVENNWGYTCNGAVSGVDDPVNVVVNEDVTDWDASGTLRIDDEEMTYASRLGSTFST